MMPLLRPYLPKLKRLRSIVCRFHYFWDKQAVWEQRSKLAGKVFRLSEEFPREIISKRKRLAPIMFEAQRQGNKASMTVDKLNIDNKTYTVDTLETLPVSLDPLKISTKPF